MILRVKQKPVLALTQTLTITVVLTQKLIVIFNPSLNPYTNLNPNPNSNPNRSYPQPNTVGYIRHSNPKVSGIDVSESPLTGV